MAGIVLWQDRQRRGARDLLVVRKEFRLRGAVEVRRDDGHGIHPHVLHFVVKRDHVTRGIGAGAGNHGHAATRVLHGNVRNAQLFFLVQRDELTVGAEHEESMDARVDQPIDQHAQTIIIHVFRRGHRGDQGWNDPFERRGHVHILSWWGGRPKLGI